VKTGKKREEEKDCTLYEASREEKGAVSTVSTARGTGVSAFAQGRKGGKKSKKIKNSRRRREGKFPFE